MAEKLHSIDKSIILSMGRCLLLHAKKEKKKKKKGSGVFLSYFIKGTFYGYIFTLNVNHTSISSYKCAHAIRQLSIILFHLVEEKMAVACTYFTRIYIVSVK
jgi:hypothetical protein